VVFFHSPQQKALAEKYKKKLDDAGVFDNPIVTEIAPYATFYPAEDYHQNYFELNGNAPYCSHIIAPKVEKFKAFFDEKLKD
jgi:peptide-methionine (S)-S-oxide reductase